MADALAAAAISAIAAALALQLLSKCAGDIRRARDDMAGTRLAERLYEEARLESAASLVSTAEGKMGALRWRRSGALVRKPVGNLADETIPVRVTIAVSKGERSLADLEAIVLPAAVTEPEASPSPKS